MLPVPLLYAWTLAAAVVVAGMVFDRVRQLARMSIQVAGGSVVLLCLVAPAYAIHVLNAVVAHFAPLASIETPVEVKQVADWWSGWRR